MNQMIKDFREGKISYEDLVDPKVMARYALEDPEYLEFIYTYQCELQKKANKITNQAELNSINFILDRYTKALAIILYDFQHERFLAAIDEEGC